MLLETYEGRGVSFLTQHGKEHLVRDVLESTLGCLLVHTKGYDTDTLGSFTREQPRSSSQLEAARSKARIGMKLTGLDVGIASEGSFAMDPYGGLFPWNVELVLWIDQRLGLEVLGRAEGPARSHFACLETQEELEQFVLKAGFPEHHVALRPEDESHPEIQKGIAEPARLLSAFGWAKGRSKNGKVFIENDLRAFCNPTRQGMIRNAVDDLLKKLTSQCPGCAAPGYCVTTHLGGLACRLCGRETQGRIAEVLKCQICSRTEVRMVNEGQLADPAFCDFCNP